MGRTTQTPVACVPRPVRRAACRGENTASARVTGCGAKG